MKIVHYIRKKKSEKEKGCRWVLPEEVVFLHGYIIKGGLFYLGNRMPKRSDPSEDSPCLINPELNLGISWKDNFASFSGYSRSLPGFRRTYLEWLADGRPPLGANSNCPMCFLYGLEHRLLVDGAKGLVRAQERTLIIQEIIRLMELNPDNLQFIDSAAYLLVCEWLAFDKKESLPKYLGLSIDKDAKVSLLQGIFQHIISGKPFSSAKLLQLTIYHPQNELLVRHSDPDYAKLFQRLFQIRYREKFGLGLKLSPGNGVTKLSYAATNSSLNGLKLQVCGLPDNLFDGDGLFEKTEKLIKLCELELQSYWEKKHRKNDYKRSLWLLSFLPAELLYIDERLKGLNKLLFEPDFRVPRLLWLNELYRRLNYEPDKENVKKDFRKMILLLEAMRFGVAPMREIHGVGSDNYEELFVFPAVEKIRAEDKSFRKALLVIRLDSLNNPSRTNFAVRHKTFLKYCHDLNTAEKNSLYAFSLWRQKYANIICKKGIDDLIKGLSVAEIKKTALVITALAGVKRSSPEEIKRLEYVYNKLKLTKNQLISDLNMFEGQSSFDDLWAENRSREDFNLDEGLLQKYEAETGAVYGLLNKVFAGGDELVPDFNSANHQVVRLDNNDSSENNGCVPVETAVSSVVVSGQTENPGKDNGKDNDDSLDGLDALHRQLFLRLIKKESWGKPELNKLCHSFDLMPEGAVENINQWFIARMDCVLIEGDDPLYVDIELVREFIE
jgi:hypothetical protein